MKATFFFFLLALFPISAINAWEQSAEKTANALRTNESADIYYIHVSPDGDDNGEGTSESPYATLQTAFLKVREIRRNVTDELTAPVHIVMHGGIYRFNSPLIITTEDSGTPLSPTIIEAAQNEKPVISGGMEIAGWQEGSAANGIDASVQAQVWNAPMPDNNMYLTATPRQMWVNNTKMKLASTFDDLSLPRLISVDKGKGELTVPVVEHKFSHPENVMMTIIQDWEVSMLRLKSIQNNGYQSTLSFMDPESSIEFKRPWPILRADETSFSNHKFFLSNAIELLDRPQEWVMNPEDGKIYYWPRYGETPDNVKAVIPTCETLINIIGEKGNKAENIIFRGITFQHTTWMRPSHQGHIPLQAGQFIYDAYSDESAPGGNVAWVGRPAAAVSLKDTREIHFEDCKFEHMGSTALDFVSGAKNSHVIGCSFQDIGGTAILAGYFGDESFEAHKAYNPEDQDVVCESILINNNYICNVATEDWGCLGICIGFAAGIEISHNEICHTPYSAISMGWGWTKESNCMHDNHIIGNYIHHFSQQMRDSGAIYTLSSQPNSSVENNRIESVGDPMLNPVMWNMRHAQFDLYLDEGSDYFTVNNNWCERGEISKNQNGSHNNWGANGNNVSNSIKDTAGIEDSYQSIIQDFSEDRYAPVDSIGYYNSNRPIIEYIAQNEGFKLGNSIAVDLNGDNLLDIVYSGGESFQVQNGGVRINTGNYSFAATQGLKRLYMGNFAAGDINGDGKMDLVQAGWDFYDNYNAVWMNQGKGRLEENVLSPTGKNTSPACGIADIDNNGLTDYFFVGNGQDNNFYLQRQDRTFNNPQSLLSLPGGFSDPNMVYADFNNDQSVDICLLSNKSNGVYTRIFYNDGTGHFTETNVGFTERGTRGGMAFADINNDGFLDIAVGGTFYGEQWNSTASQGGKTVTVYLNNQDGSFTKCQELSEYMFDNVTQPVRFCDWDNDGNSDLIVTGWNMSEGNISRTDVFINDGTGLFTKINSGLPGVSESSIELADFGNSGRNDILISGNCNGGYNGFTSDRRIAVLVRNNIEKSNTLPSPPANLHAEIIDKGSVRLSWDAGSDAETNTNALSYNYYIKDLSTGLYMTFPNADITTGKRWVSQMGNAWLNHSWTLRNLPTGTYAWSVQTIDAAYAGSQFAQEQVFTIEEGVEDLETIEYPEPKTDLTPVTTLVDGTEYVMQNSNENLTKRNLYWEWGQYLRTQSSGNIDDVKFIANEKIIDGKSYWSFKITSSTGQGRYFGRVNDANIGITSSETLWIAEYVESEGEEGNGFRLLLKSDKAGEGHELTMNGSADWVCAYVDGNTIDKTANTTHWSFYRTEDLSADALSEYNQANFTLYKYLLETLQMNDRGITSMTGVYKECAAIYNSADKSIDEINQAISRIKEAINQTETLYSPGIEATYGIINPSFENTVNQHDTSNAEPFGWTLTKNGESVTGSPWAWFGANTDGTEKDRDYIWGIWNGSNYGDIELKQTLTNLPNGVWKVTARLMMNNTEPGNSARIFANDKSMVAGGAADFTSLPEGEQMSFANGWASSDFDMSHVAVLYTEVTDGTLTIGVKTNGFFKVDDFQLTLLKPADSMVEINVDNGPYATLITPAPLNLDDAPEGLHFYKVTDYELGQPIYIEEISGAIGAGQPILIKSDNDASYALSICTGVYSANLESNMLRAVNNDVKGDGKTIYVLDNRDSRGQGFYRLNSGERVERDEAYLIIADTNEDFIPILSIADDIEDINEDQTGNNANGNVYDLPGRRLNRQSSGINIINGKKIITQH